jgi:subtilisin family serine protease
VVHEVHVAILVENCYDVTIASRKRHCSNRTVCCIKYSVILSRARRLGLALAIVSTVVLSTPAVASAGDPVRPERRAQHTVTLLTGDRVLVEDGAYRPVPAAGREGTAFHLYEVDGHQYVVPVDAAPAVASGRLDRRLFDVTALLEFGYDDAGRADIPLIVKGRPSVTGATTSTRLPSLAATTVKVRKSQATSAWADVRTGTSTVWLDGLRSLALAESVPQTGAPAAWEAGYTGAGVEVAVLDSGIDATHPDFEGRIAATKDFTGTGMDDITGHGTHVASTVLGSGAASDGKYRGMAPDALLVAGKVCPDETCAESDIIAGMEWAAREQGARVINMSLGGLDSEDVDPLEAAVNQLTEQTGALFVISAGNDGIARPVSSPASADAALAVGAVTKQHEHADFSSRGPRFGDGALKPDIAAPGVEIMAALGASSDSWPADGPYTPKSGTSMAAPHVAGAAALMVQAHPEWGPEEVKSALTSSARPTPTPDVFAEGAGELDVARAITQDVIATTTGVNLGRPRWPHHDDEPVKGEVAYRNLGTEPVTLSLSLQTGAAPAGMFSLSADTVTVPAGGTATVGVGADTRVAGQEGYVTARLVATAAGTVIGTPVVVHKEVESYDLTLRQLGRDGKPAPIEDMTVLDVNSGEVEWPYAPSGSVTLRLPAGQYFVDTRITEAASLSQLVRPLIELDRDTTVTLDARNARPTRPQLPDRDAQDVLRQVGVVRQIGDPNGSSLYASEISAPAEDMGTPLYTESTGPELPEDELISWAHLKYAVPGPDGDTLDSPTLYNLFWTWRGTYPTGLAARLTSNQLARVTQRYHAVNEGTYGFHSTVPTAPGIPRQFLSGMSFAVTLPITRTAYYLSQGPGAAWTEAFSQTASPDPFDTISAVYTEPASYQPGRRYDQPWNAGVFGTGLDPNSFYSSYRVGDVMTVYASPYRDSGPGRTGQVYPTEESSITLYRNGELVTRQDWFMINQVSVPREESEYRVVVRLRTDATKAPLSNDLTTEWTFRSGYTPEGAQAPLPLIVTTVAPDLDAYNSTRAGRPSWLPITVEANPGSSPGEVTEVTAEESYDDGATWHRISVKSGPDGWRAKASNSGTKGGYASLRITAATDGGSTVSQTTLHAYRLS